MLRANLLRFPVLPAPEVVQSATNRLIFQPSPRSQRLLDAINIPALTPELRDNLLGKAPLRLVSARAKILPNVWKEKLQCGHEVTAYQNFLWDEKQHLVNLEPSAIRRRCQECKEILSVADASRSAAAPLPGSEAPDSRNSQIQTARKPEWIAGGQLTPPRKPVQSVPDPKKRRAA